MIVSVYNHSAKLFRFHTFVRDVVKFLDKSNTGVHNSNNGIDSNICTKFMGKYPLHV